MRSAPCRWSASRRRSISREIWRRCSSGTRRCSRKGPKIVMHVGGMSPRPGGYDLEGATGPAARRAAAARHDGRRPAAREPAAVSRGTSAAAGSGTCSAMPRTPSCSARNRGSGSASTPRTPRSNAPRAAPACSSSRKAVTPYVRHLHMSDGAGTSGEGLQIGDGSVNFVALLPVLLEPQPTVIPEIWMGHHENGLAFRAALERLTEIRWASLVLGRPSDRRTRAGPPRAHRHARRDRVHGAPRDRHQPDGHRLRARQHAGASSGSSPTATSVMRSSAASTCTTKSARR